MKKILMEDIASIRCANGLKLSPDGKHAVYAVIEPDRKENRYRTDLYLLDTQTDHSRRLTYSGNNGWFDWEDDTTLLIMTERQESDKAKELEEKTAFYRLNITGGEAAPAFTVDCNVLSAYRLEEGKYLLKVLVDANRLTDGDEETRKEEQDYHVVTEVPFWGNGRGYVAGRRNILFLYDEKTGKRKQISPDGTNAGVVRVQGDEIIYISRTWTERFPISSGLRMYDRKTGRTKQLVREGKYRIDDILFAKNGVLMLAADMKKWGTGQSVDFYLWDRKTKKETMILQNSDGMDLCLADTPMADTVRPGGITWKCVKDHVYFTAMKNWHTDLYRFSLKAKKPKAQMVTDFAGGAIVCFDTDGKQTYMIGSQRAGLNVLCRAENASYRVIADFNEDLLKDRYIAQPEYVPFTDRDGVKIDGWVLKPIDFDPKKKYPGILEIHGGPRAAYGTLFYHEMQMWASEGWFVFFCNPRGSSGYGEAFADLRGKYGTIDYTDLMDFTDHVLQKYPQIDETKLGASGGSYGGFMCNWIEGHTDRFSAIASQRSIANWISDFGTSEIGVTFDFEEMAASPWTDVMKMWEQSPLKYADQAKTPILFIHSLQDYNCPISQGAEMFTAMKYFGVPSRMVLFEGENHSLSRNGKPRHRIRRLKEMTEWFRLYLSGKQEIKKE